MELSLSGKAAPMGSRGIVLTSAPSLGDAVCCTSYSTISAAKNGQLGPRGAAISKQGVHMLGSTGASKPRHAPTSFSKRLNAALMAEESIEASLCVKKEAKGMATQSEMAFPDSGRGEAPRDFCDAADELSRPKAAAEAPQQRIDSARGPARAAVRPARSKRLSRDQLTTESETDAPSCSTTVSKRTEAVEARGKQRPARQSGDSRRRVSTSGCDANQGAVDDLSPSLAKTMPVLTKRPVHSVPLGATVVSDSDETNESRMRALQRVRARKERESRETEAKASKEEQERENKGKSAKEREEEREQHRAEIYAINKLMTARDAEAWGVFVAERATQLEELAVKHAKEIEARKEQVAEHAKEAERSMQQRIRAREAEADRQKDTESPKQRRLLLREEQRSRDDSREGKAQVVPFSPVKRQSMRRAPLPSKLTVFSFKEQEDERKAAQVAMKREQVREKGEEREIFRAQVYAMNKLMRAKEEANFRLFKEKQKQAAEAAAAAESKGVDSNGTPKVELTPGAQPSVEGESLQGADAPAESEQAS